MSTTFALSGFQWRGVWGERTNSTPSRGYCANLGHPEDETGLVYMRARYYEPATGRFISEDPARDGVNWYLYADGDPVNRVDVDGKASINNVMLWAIGAVLTILAAYGYAFGAILSYLVGGKQGCILGCLPKFAQSLFVGSQATSVIAAWFFGLSAIGLDLPLNSQYAIAVLTGISGGLLVALQIAIKGTGEGLRSANSFTAIALLANVINCVSIIGYIASEGVENR